MRRVRLPAAGEDVVLDGAGRAYVGCADGGVWCVDLGAELDADPGRERLRLVARTGGRPLGLELLDEDRLVVCDSERGLLLVHRVTGAVDELVTTAAGRRLRFCNNAAVADDGAIWFTDSSAVHGRPAWRAEMVHASRTGRLLRRDPDGTVEERLVGLDFANGVVVVSGGAGVLVAETGARRVRLLHVEGPRAGTDEVVLDDLPGYPDNLALGTDGLLWVALASPRDGALEAVRRAPAAVRRPAGALAHALRLPPRASVHARAHRLPDLGRPVHDVRLRPDGFSMVTGVREHHGTLWLASLRHPVLAGHAVASPGTA